MTLDEILEEIKLAETIVILTHESPDGDAVGSSLGTKLMIEKLGKKADVIIPEYSRLFNFLPEVETIKKESGDSRKVEIYECNDYELEQRLDGLSAGKYITTIAIQ